MYWFFDHGAFMHMSMREDWFVIKVASEVEEIVVDNNSQLQVTAMGQLF